jgi:hypothetical protein
LRDNLKLDYRQAFKKQKNMKLNHKEHRENAEEQFEQQSHGY